MLITDHHTAATVAAAVTDVGVFVHPPCKPTWHILGLTNNHMQLWVLVASRNSTPTSVTVLLLLLHCYHSCCCCAAAAVVLLWCCFSSHFAVAAVAVAAKRNESGWLSDSRSIIEMHSLD